MRAPYFAEIAEFLQPLYVSRHFRMLSELNRDFILAICRYLNIPTQIRDSSEFTLPVDRNERLIHICKETHASAYVSGPAAKSYLQEDRFHQSGIAVQWFDYSGYPEYGQQWPYPFTHQVSIVDLLFNCGPTSRAYLKHVRT
jgi:hypothetical protein